MASCLLSVSLVIAYRPPGLVGRRAALSGGAAVAASWGNINPASANPKLFTGEVVATVNGIRHKRLGGGELIVSEVGLGTQRWGSSDFNGPDEALCHKFMDRAILGGGVNLIDTAEQYPIPSDSANREGSTERIIGSWLAKDPSRRQKVLRFNVEPHWVAVVHTVAFACALAC